MFVQRLSSASSIVRRSSRSRMCNAFYRFGTRDHIILQDISRCLASMPFRDIENDALLLSQSLPITASFTEDELMAKESARTWANEILRPKVRNMDESGSMDPIILKNLFAQGFMGLEIPEEYGGSGLSFTAACLAIEELARVDPSVAVMTDIQNTLINNAVRFWGSPQMHDRWLPRLASGSLSSFCLSEAGSGSDAFSLKTTATKSRDGSYYTLNGSKLWISNAREADILLVFANVDPSAGYKGITAFLVDVKDYEAGNGNGSITIGQPESKLGLRACSTCAVHFDDAKVPSSNILGSVGMGYRYCIEILNEGRIGIAAQQLGIAKGCLYDIGLPYMMERQQFGSPIANFQGMEHQYAQIATEIHAAEIMTYNACRLKELHQEEGGPSFAKEASMAKLYCSQIAEKTASKTIEWLGGIGFTKDVLAEKMYRDCKVGSIYEGTSNMQLQTIAKIMRSEYDIESYPTQKVDSFIDIEGASLNEDTGTEPLHDEKEMSQIDENQLTSLLMELPDRVGILQNVLKFFKQQNLNIRRIESRPSKDGKFDFFVDVEVGTADEDDERLYNLRASLKEFGVEKLLFLDEKEVTWFPRHVSELDLVANRVLDVGTDLEADHPGFHDQTYRKRRHELADFAMNHKYNKEIAEIEYTENEIKCWTAVWDRMEPLLEKYACKEYLHSFDLMVKHCNYERTSIPKQSDISNFLESTTNFKLRPVAGLLSSRDFLNGLAHRTFFCTQYIRHHSKPLYTPEPDICHELLGHAPMFANQDFCDFSQEIGLASLGASDDDIERLARCYWFSVEFGLCKEFNPDKGEDEMKAYGAGLLSSFGELEYACGEKEEAASAPEIQPWDPSKAALQEFPITTYQPLYFLAESLADAKNKMRKYCEDLPRPFFAQYNNQTQTVFIDRQIKRMDIES